jgi:hypothetical protein
MSDTRVSDDVDMRMRTLIHLILACLVAGVLVAPAASAHGRRGHERSNHNSRHDRDGEERSNRGGRRPRSFFGVGASGSCSKDPWACDLTFSRSNTSELHERLDWLLTEKIDAVESFAERVCSRANKENECAGSFVAGLWNGLDATEIAVAGSSCATLRIAWAKGDGFSQTWGITDGSACTD